MRRMILVLLVLSCLAAGLSAQQFETSNCGTFEPFENTTSFVLVVDRSGSMSGAGIQQARDALRSFVSQVRDEDRVALVSFSDDVTIDTSFTRSSGSLNAAIDRLRAEGGTRLYDAVAAGARLLEGERGVRVIVYLTDGVDNRSNLTLRNIRQMNIGENVIVYGMGLGEVDSDALRGLSYASNGAYGVVDRPEELRTMYQVVREQYYERFDAELADSGALTVTSIPSGRPVTINGQEVGRTPLRFDGVNPGDYNVEVAFERGVWRCVTAAREGTRTLVEARQSDVPYQLIIETAPTRAAVFLNGDYVGLSSMAPSPDTEDGKDVSGQLTIDSIPRGSHTVRVVAAPELAFSPNQVLEFPVEITNDNVYVKALIFMRQLEDLEGNVRRAPAVQGGGESNPLGSSPFGDDSGDDPFGNIRSRVPGGQQ